MQNPAAFQATFCDWRLVKGRKVIQIVLEVPLEISDQAYQVLGGMPDPGKSVWCAVARLVEAAADKPVKPRTKVAPEKRLAQQAGILCADPVFQKFLNVEDEAAAASYVRQFCGIKSRSELVLGSQEAEKWDQIYSRFVAWRDVPELVP